MIKNKVCFIHARMQNAAGELSHLGGATIAWKVDNAGNIVVGQPARCRPNERFVKSEGRKEALKKLNEQAAFFSVSSQQLAQLAASQAILSMNFSPLTPAGRSYLMESAARLAYAFDLTEVMGSNWYEQQVRDRLAFVRDRVEYNPEADVSDFGAHFQSVQLILDNASSVLIPLDAETAA